MPVSDTDVKLHVYRTTAATGQVPKMAEVASALGLELEQARGAFQRLASVRVLALDPESGEIIMAPPFSAIETPFEVEAAGKRYWANCVWDSLGVAAALHADADVTTTCGDCGQPMSLAVRDGRVVDTPCVMHYAVPAAHWWDDIFYT